MGYTSEKSIQILIALLKANNISKVIASPGTMNISFVGSIQNDPFFTIYSAPDERSGAYIACGLSKESGEIVVLTCTGATASRNYFPGLTEAYYSKLPILAVTFTQSFSYIGHNRPQVLDRRIEPNDILVKSVHIPLVRNNEDLWFAEIQINDVINSISEKGYGPGHINMVSECNSNFKLSQLPKVRYIKKYKFGDMLPDISAKNVGIYVSEHGKWSKKLCDIVDIFCEKFNGVVFCDRTSNYNGKYGILASLLCSQDYYYSKLRTFDLMIHIGNVFGTDMGMMPREVWRVNPDGKIRDTFGKISKVFEMEEDQFFQYYAETDFEKNISFYHEWEKECLQLEKAIPELPFSNAWIAKETLRRMVVGSNLHMGILNSLRCWSFFENYKYIHGHSNTGGFGIDGCISTLVGASLYNPDQIYYGVVGDLAFFYDMNVLGNRHVGNNVRLIVVNNGKGTEFKMYNHLGNIFGSKADDYIAAGNHYGRKSENLIRNYSEDLGYKYLTAHNKREFVEKIDEFLSPLTENSKSIVFEVFTTEYDESEALKLLRNIRVSEREKSKQILKNIWKEKGVRIIKKLIKRW